MDYRKESLVRYLDDAAAAQPTPGGGSVAAVAAALASTMASMAANFTAGKEKFEAVDAEVRAIADRLSLLCASLLDLAHQDMAAYEGIMAAWRLPKETEEQRFQRSRAVRLATERSLACVGAVLTACKEILEESRRLAEIANPNLISDVGVAAELALGAVHASWINLEVNLRGYDSPTERAAARTRGEDVVARAERLAAETRRIVLEALRR